MSTKSGGVVAVESKTGIRTGSVANRWGRSPPNTLLSCQSQGCCPDPDVTADDHPISRRSIDPRIGARGDTALYIELGYRRGSASGLR